MSLRTSASSAPLDSCHIYTDYLYEATHYNNPG